MSPTTADASVATIGIDIGKNTFHVVGFNSRGKIVLRQKMSRAQVEVRFANLPRSVPGSGGSCRFMFQSRQ
jgi:transposase